MTKAYPVSPWPPDPLTVAKAKERCIKGPIWQSHKTHLLLEIFKAREFVSCLCPAQLVKIKNDLSKNFGRWCLFLWHLQQLVQHLCLAKANLMCIEIFHQKITWEKPTFKGKFGERSASPTLWSCYSSAIQQANKSNHNLPQRAVSCLRHCKTLTSSRKTTPRRSSWESFQEKQIQDFSAKFGIVLVHTLAHFRTGEPQSVNLIHLMPLQICWHLQSAPRCPVTNHATIIWFCTMWGMNRYEAYRMKRCNVLVKHITRRRSDTRV